jgi:hypothetical protein
VSRELGFFICNKRIAIANSSFPRDFSFSICKGYWI